MNSTKAKPSKLKSLPSQDPHSVRVDKERNLEAAIGKEV
ncbi:MAG: MerR family transcriptional regulator, partial [Rhodobacteraceae bacterium]|nr:MerR family transcriptional regulator [Paracoccaceae bacterium]